MDLADRIAAHEAWWRDQSTGARLVLQNSDLSGCDLQGRQLVRAKLSNVDLTAANLWNCNLARAELTDVTLARANMRGCSLRDSKLQCVNMNEIQGAEFDLDGASGADLQFVRAQMPESSMAKSDFDRVDFSYAILTSANMHRLAVTGGRLFRADLSGANLTYALFSDVDLRSATIKGAKFERTRMRKVRVAGLQGFSATPDTISFEMVDFSRDGDGSELGNNEQFFAAFAHH